MFEVLDIKVSLPIVLLIKNVYVFKLRLILNYFDFFKFFLMMSSALSCGFAKIPAHANINFRFLFIFCNLLEVKDKEEIIFKILLPCPMLKLSYFLIYIFFCISILFSCLCYINFLSFFFKMIIKTKIQMFFNFSYKIIMIFGLMLGNCIF